MRFHVGERSTRHPGTAQCAPHHVDPARHTGLWQRHHERADPSVYNVVQRVDIDGDLDPAAPARAFRDLVRRHAALRTRAVRRDGDLLVEVLDTVRVDLPVTDLAGTPREVDRWCRAHEVVGLHDRAAADSLFPTTLFTVVTTPPPTFSLADATAVVMTPTRPGSARNEPYVVLVPSADGIHVVMEYSTDLFDNATVVSMGAEFSRTPASLVDAPRQPLRSGL
ncbi:condensation domain-containing protein [Saccharothrix saharensis]|uniref:Condensation domain-containing protein n=1 Tax=Saccharothrix saharensis TaxID=571190 RepID=A0A543J7G7_9PSEU|nr:hypothetical protein [Saccharothrix saharensis]TQM78774.1 condensation domain-containing protein [Saccharothrix saharensis]